MIKTLALAVGIATVLGLALHSAPGIDQIGAQSAASPDQQALERFQSWLKTVSAEQLGNDALVAYRQHLKSRGLSDAEIGREVDLVLQAHARMEFDTWNQILTAKTPRFNTKPNAFLVEIARTRKPGAALDVGMGQGRNSIWLAQQGWDVTGFDPADKAVAQAEDTARVLGVHLKTSTTRLEDFDFGEGRWDLILLSYVGGHERVDTLQRALKPGGVLVIEAFHADAAKVNRIGRNVVFETGELPHLFPALRTVRYEEPVAQPDFGDAPVRLVRYCGERPSS